MLIAVMIRMFLLNSTRSMADNARFDLTAYAITIEIKQMPKSRRKIIQRGTIFILPNKADNFS